MISLTRVYRFSASHRLHSQELSDAENAAIFGKCNNPYGHGHDYVLSVTVAGTVDEASGRLIAIGELDQLVQEKVLHRFANRNINLDVPQFADAVPTTENVAIVIANLLQDGGARWCSRKSVRLLRVHLQETERNGFEVHIPVLSESKPAESEGLLVNA